jgi:hypothetical protein
VAQENPQVMAAQPLYDVLPSPTELHGVMRASSR